MLDRGHAGRFPSAAAGDGGDLLLCQPRDKPQRRKHLHMLFIDRRDLADRLLAGSSKVEMQAELQVFAELQVTAGARRGVAIGGDRPRLHRRSAAADRALDVVFDHEVEPARVGADDRLPALDRTMDRARHQGQLLERVAAIRHFRRQRVVLALVRK